LCGDDNQRIPILIPFSQWPHSNIVVSKNPKIWSYLKFEG
jgi:hypothetical protein